MALDRQQMGLLFKLDADSKSAQADVQAFREFMKGVVTGIRQEAEVEFKRLRNEVDELNKKLEDTGKKGGKGLDDLGKKSKASAAIVKESVETFSSEIIESFGVDGDIANTLGKEISGLSKETLILGGVFVGVTAAAVGVGAALFSIAKSTTEALTSIGDLNEKTGLSVETISALKPTLEQNGASLDKFGNAVNELNDKLIKARNGNKEFADGFKKLGVDIQQGAEPALAQIVKKYNELPEGAERTAFATNVFGQAGEDLVLTLNSLNGNLDAHTAKMRELGLVVTPQAVAEAKKFDDQLKQMQLQLQATQQTIGQFVIPTFTGLLGVLNGVSKSILEVINGSRGLGSALGSAAGFASLGGSFGALGLASGKSDRQKINEDAANALAIEQELQARQDGPKKTNPLPFGDGKKKTGAKPDTASDARLKQLQIQLQEEEKANRSARDAIKRTYDQRAIDEQEFANQQIAQANDRLAKELAILDKEKAVVEGSKFSADKKKTELERIAAARKDLERQTADDIERIDEDLRKRLEQAGIAFEQAQAQAQDAALKRRAGAINAALQDGILSNEEAERQLTEIAQKGIENRIALANAEVDRTGANSQLKAVALEKVKALEIELAASVESAGARIQAARAKDLEDLRRYVEARDRAQQDLQAAEVDALDREARRLERQAGLGLGTGAQAISARQAADLAQAAFERDLALKRIEDRRVELQGLADTSAQAVEVERLANDQRLAEEERYQQEKARIKQEARAAELELQGFDQATADAIAQQELLNGRTLALWEQLRAGAQTTVDSLRSTLPSLGALFVQTGNTIANALTTSISAFASGATSVRKAAAEFFKAALAPLKEYLLKKSKIQFAEAIASLAVQDYRGFALHTLAGTALAAAAGLIDAGGSAIAGGGGGAVAPSAGGGTNAQPQGPRTIDQGNPIDRPGAQVVLIRAEHAPGVVVELVRQDIAGNGVLREAIQREGGG